MKTLRRAKRTFPTALLSLAAAALLTAGCAHTPEGETETSQSAPRETEPQPAMETRFEIASNVEGKVVTVRPDLRYVIIDFSFSRLPKPGAGMAVFRDDKQVGKVRITSNPSQARGGAAVADIREGELAVGDFVRFE